MTPQALREKSEDVFRKLADSTSWDNSLALLESALREIRAQTIDECAKVADEGDSVLCMSCEGNGLMWADGKAHYPNHKGQTVSCDNCDGSGTIRTDIVSRILALLDAGKEKR